MEITELERKIELMNQQIALLVPGKSKRVKLLPLPRTLTLKVRAGNIWGELVLDFPDGYKIEHLEDDIDEIANIAPIYESSGGITHRKRRKRRTLEEDEL
jgi:hypothetical protein